MHETIRPFRLDVPQADLYDLRERMARMASHPGKDLDGGPDGCE